MMLMSLFSVFDPSTSYSFSFNWISLVLFIYMLPVSYFYFKGSIESIVGKILNKMSGDFEGIAKDNSYGIVFFVVSLFFFISVNNVMGLMPFIFTATSHPMITVSLGLVLWMGFFLMGLMKNFKSLVVHLVPEGSPILLSFFMVMIEFISQVVRPVTLSIRLAANMMAGHLIMGLLSSISMNFMSGMIISIFLQMFLLVLEVGVCLIQSFVFSVLLLLYMLEYY